ncbi:MAG TPA: hypothetical protein VGK74_22760 [Symbiobacteriaceae bacterium]|jgi:hypothetical protein
MSQTYSTRERDRGGGQAFSSPQSRVTVLSLKPGGAVGTAGMVAVPVSQAASPGSSYPPAPPFPQPWPAALPLQPAPAVQVGPAVLQEVQPAPLPGFRFTLTGQGLPAAAQLAPGGMGVVVVAGPSGGPLQVSSALTGVWPLADPSLHPVLWLIHDLTVPVDLAPADLAALPKGAAGVGNLPGTVFTLDGNPPTYLQGPNTLSVAVTPGGYVPAPGGGWQMIGVLDDATNQAFHPLVALGPSGATDWQNASLPSGIVARVFTDLFMRPVTIHPEIALQAQFPQRLAAIVGDAVGNPAPAYLDLSCFTRAAVTLEGLTRGTPRLMPTRETCFLIALNRDGA